MNKSWIRRVDLHLIRPRKVSLTYRQSVPPERNIQVFSNIIINISIIYRKSLITLTRLSITSDQLTIVCTVRLCVCARGCVCVCVLAGHSEHEEQSLQIKRETQGIMVISCF